MNGPRSQKHLLTVRWATALWWIWLVCGYLLVGGVTGNVDSTVQPDRVSGRTLPTRVQDPPSPLEAGRLPRVAPDYVGVVIPPNLAPLNLVIRETGTEYRLRLSGSRGRPLEIQQAHPGVRFPLSDWRGLLQTNRGGKLRWNIAARNLAGRWISYTPFTTAVAEEEIDPFVVYRRLKPLYSTYRHLGVYQRHLESFEEKPLLRNEKIAHGCVNCHTFQKGSPDRFAISFRGRFGTPTLLINSNQISRVDKKMGYLSWHPNGKMLAFAANRITQFFHTAGPVNRDIYDAQSDIGILHIDDRRVEKPAAIAAPGYNENWPCWAPDGRNLYYCSGPTAAFEDVGDFRYDLLRIPYDPQRNQWGTPETLISGTDRQLSAHRPRPSPDGRHLVFTISDTGSFPLFRPESDLALLGLESREIEPLPVNSDHAETWPCWSSNSRWLIFGSRGLDGVFARLLITHVDRSARFSKPLLLPQEDPAYYDTCLDNFNVPELVRGPIRISEEELARAADPPGPTPGSTEPIPAADQRPHP